MPTVIYNPQMTRSAGAPAARNIPSSGPFREFLPTDSFGVAPMNPTAVGQGIAAVGQGLDRLGKAVQDFQERASTTAAEEALVNFEREKNTFFFDPETGYFNTQGRDAFDQKETAIESLTKLQQKYSDSINDVNARDMFSRASTVQITRAQQDILRHASTQFDAWETATLNARLENTLENASLYWNNPSKRAVQLELGRQAIIDISMIKGASPESTAEELQTYNSRFATATIESALGVSSAAGQQALAENKDMLEAPDILKVQSKIDTKMQAEIQQRNSSAAITIATSLVSQFGDMASARSLITAEIEEIEDPDLRSKALRESTYQLDNRMRAKSESQAATFEVAERFLMQGGSVDQFIAANPDGWQGLTPAQQRTLKPGEVITTDFSTLQRLLNLPQEDLARVNPADYVDRLAERDRRYLEDQVKSAITGAPEGQVGRTRTAQVTSVITRIFGDDKKWKNETREQVDAFYSMITAEEEYRQQLKGSPLSADEFNSMLNDMTRKAVIERKWLPDQTLSLPSVPASEVAPISAILRGSGYPVTSDNIIKIYRQREELRAQGNLPEIGQPSNAARVFSNATGPLRSGYRLTE